MEKSTKIKMFRLFLIGIVIVFLSLTMSCFNSNDNNFQNVDEMLCLPKPKPPISSSEEAICFAAYINGVAESLRSAQQQAKYDGWTVKVCRGEDFNGWKVDIHSKGKILPSYVCKLSFTENGELLNQEPQCGYKK